MAFGAYRVKDMAEAMALKARIKKNLGGSEIPCAVEVPKESKFHAVLVEAHERTFPSKKHYRFFLDLVCQQKAGMIRYFIEEVPFKLPGVFTDKRGRKRRATHRVDFGICQLDETFRWVEVKGKDLPEGKLKRMQVQDLYKIEIEVV